MGARGLALIALAMTGVLAPTTASAETLELLCVYDTEIPPSGFSPNIEYHYVIDLEQRTVVYRDYPLIGVVPASVSEAFIRWTHEGASTSIDRVSGTVTSINAGAATTRTGRCRLATQRF